MAYKSLDPNLQEIRLASVEPGEPASDVRCTLSVVSLLEKPTYDALSYTWGDERITSVIYLDDKPFHATLNLAIALQHLRSHQTQRTIWIDALCINQQDTPERNSQVAIMGDIYRNAAEVVAWLGPVGENSDLAFDLFLTIARESRETKDGKHWLPPGQLSSTNATLEIQQLQAVSSLIARPWWRRMWTVQELLLPRKILFQCGERQISAEALFATSDSYFAHVHHCCEAHFRSTFDIEVIKEFNESISVIDRLGVARVSESNTLSKSLTFFRHRECKDPRDMIYGLLGVATDISKEEIVPDYNSTVSKVYADTTALVIQKSKSLQIFSLLYRQPASQSSADSLKLPSWVADWTTRWSDMYITATMIRLGFQSQYFAAGGPAGKSFFTQSSDGVANYRCLVIGEIKSLTSARPAEFKTLDLETLSEWQKAMDVEEVQDVRYPSWWTGSIPLHQQVSTRIYNTWLDAFYRVLCSSVVPKKPLAHASAVPGTERVAYNTRYLFNAWVDYTKTQESSSGDNVLRFPNFDTPPDRWKEVQLTTLGTHMSASTLSRRMFRMSDPKFNEEWLGLVPAESEVGDYVAVLEGGDVPYVIRFREDLDDGDTGFWQLVGDAYVEGVMEGQATRCGDEIAELRFV